MFSLFSGGAQKKRSPPKKTTKPKKAHKPKIHVGPSGGKYYIRRGRKVYV